MERITGCKATWNAGPWAPVCIFTITRIRNESVCHTNISTRSITTFRICLGRSMTSQIMSFLNLFTNHCHSYIEIKKFPYKKKNLVYNYKSRDYTFKSRLRENLGLFFFPFYITLNPVDFFTVTIGQDELDGFFCFSFSTKIKILALNSLRLYLPSVSLFSKGHNSKTLTLEEKMFPVNKFDSTNFRYLPLLIFFQCFSRR